jgi:hypothetical protein
MNADTNTEHRDLAGDAFRRLLARWRAGRTPGEPALEEVTPQAFRAIVADRLRALERELSEVRARVNGLLFVTAGAVLTQLLLRLLG